MQLFLMRHGETEWSRTGQHTGTTDLALLADGLAQAEALAAVLARRLDGRPLAAVYASPLKRARQTAAIALPGQPVELDADLREFDYGDYESLTTAEIRGRAPGWNIWRDGCPNGETTPEVGRRADRFLERCARIDGQIAVFSHGHMLRILGARALSLAPEQGRLFALDTASLSIIEDLRGVPVVALWNLTPPRS